MRSSLIRGSPPGGSERTLSDRSSPAVGGADAYDAAAAASPGRLPSGPRKPQKEEREKAQRRSRAKSVAQKNALNQNAVAAAIIGHDYEALNTERGKQLIKATWTSGQYPVEWRDPAVGATLLHVALLIPPSDVKESRQIVELLLETSQEVPDPDYINKDYTHKTYKGESALHIAVIRWDAAMVKYLLDKGANPMADCSEGTFYSLFVGLHYYGGTPFSFAASLGRPDIMKVLLNHYKTAQKKRDMLWFRDKHGNNALHMAVLYKQKESYEFIMGQGQNLLGIQWKTVMSPTVSSRAHEQAKAKAGADKGTSTSRQLFLHEDTNKEGLCPTLIAVQKGKSHTEMLKLCLQTQSSDAWKYGPTTCKIYDVYTLERICSAMHFYQHWDVLLDCAPVRHYLQEKWDCFANQLFFQKGCAISVYSVLFILSITYPDVSRGVVPSCVALSVASVFLLWEVFTLWQRQSHIVRYLGGKNTKDKYPGRGRSSEGGDDDDDGNGDANGDSRREAGKQQRWSDAKGTEMGPVEQGSSASDSDSNSNSRSANSDGERSRKESARRELAKQGFAAADKEADAEDSTSGSTRDRLRTQQSDRVSVTATRSEKDSDWQVNLSLYRQAMLLLASTVSALQIFGIVHFATVVISAAVALMGDPFDMAIVQASSAISLTGYLLLYISAIHPDLLRLVAMLGGILIHDLLRWGFIFLVLLLGFALATYRLMECSSTDTDCEHFGSWSSAVATLALLATTGEAGDFAVEIQAGANPRALAAVLALYIWIMYAVMFNVLIAMLSTTYRDYHASGGDCDYVWSLWASIINYAACSVPRWLECTPCMHHWREMKRIGTYNKTEDNFLHAGVNVLSIEHEEPYDPDEHTKQRGHHQRLQELAKELDKLTKEMQPAVASDASKGGDGDSSATPPAEGRQQPVTGRDGDGPSESAVV